MLVCFNATFPLSNEHRTRVQHLFWFLENSLAVVGVTVRLYWCDKHILQLRYGKINASTLGEKFQQTANSFIFQCFDETNLLTVRNGLQNKHHGFVLSHFYFCKLFAHDHKILKIFKNNEFEYEKLIY